MGLMISVGHLEEYTRGQGARVLRPQKSCGARVWGKEGPGHNGVWKEAEGARGSGAVVMMGVPGCR